MWGQEHKNYLKSSVWGSLMHVDATQGTNYSNTHGKLTMVVQVEEEVPLDADAFLDSLSAADDDDTATAMDDLATFLRRTSHQVGSIE